MSITTEQLQQLQAKVALLVEDKQAADLATAQSNQADANLAAATNAAGVAKLAEQQADATATADLVDLLLFVDALAAPPPPPPPPPLPTAP